MSRRGSKGRYSSNRSRNQPTLSSVAREHACSISGNSPILAVFLQASKQLTERQDRHERLVKLSRDITIESKRIIFLLHAAVTKEKSKEEIITEAKQRINHLINGPIKAIAIELEEVPAYLYSRAVTAGLQEFIEARTLCSLMETKQIIPFTDVQNELVYTIASDEDEDRKVVKVTLLPHLDYMLGLADLSGELMRKAINSISGGDSDECFFACQVVRQLYAGFLGLFCAGQLLNSKLSTTRMNVYKVEQAVYALRVRGGEAPSLLLVPPGPSGWESAAADNDMDEGFY